MAERHRRDFFFLADANKVVGSVERAATPSEQDSAFRFSQIVPRQAPPSSIELLRALAQAMVSMPPETDGEVPAGFTYLGQFVDHDLTRDVTKVAFNTPVSVTQLIRAEARRSTSIPCSASGRPIRRACTSTRGTGRS